VIGTDGACEAEAKSMRINCPDCDAQYEVPDEAIPADGRDVQCSNCGRTWFFEHPDHPGAAPDTAALSADPADLEDMTAPAPRRELDPDVAEILRAEAERERAARAREAREPLEVQTDLGLMPGRAKHPRQVEQGEEADTGDTAVMTSPSRQQEAASSGRSIASSSRRDRLPDVEEVSSFLRTGEESGTMRTEPQAMQSNTAQVLQPDSEEIEAETRRGFRRGFFLAILIFVSGLLVYQFAPGIAAGVPAADPWISKYVTLVDDTRATLDTNIRRTLDWIETQAAQLAE
jgi:predicted Zn finger-like uncharacterized protein